MLLTIEMGTVADWFSGLAAAAVLIWTILEARKYSMPSAEVFMNYTIGIGVNHYAFGIINHGRVTIGITSFELRRVSDGALITGGKFNNPPVQTVKPEEIFTHTIPNEEFKRGCARLSITYETDFEYTFFGTKERRYRGRVKLDPSSTTIYV